MAEENKPVVLTFTGGINARQRSADIDIEECTEGENFNLDFQSAVLAPRRGLSIRAVAPNNEPVRMIAQLVKNDGTLSTIIQAGGTVYSWDGTATGFIEVGNVDPAARLRGPIDSNFTLDAFLIITDLAKIENVKKWTGEIFTDLEHNLSTTLQAKYVSVQNERAVFANVKAGTDTPHVILGSKIGDSENLTVTDRPSSALGFDDPFFIPMPDLRPINGLVHAFNVFLLSTERGRLYILAGKDAQDFAFQDFHAGSAVSGDEAMVNIGNDVALGLPGRIETLRAVLEFGDVETNDASWWISPLIDGTFGDSVSTWKLIYDQAGQRVFCFPNNEDTAWVLHKHLLFGPNRQVGGKGLSPWSKWTTAAVDGLRITAIGAIFDPTDSPALISTSPGASFTNFSGGTTPIIFFGTGGNQSGSIFVVKKDNPPIDAGTALWIMGGADNEIAVSSDGGDNWIARNLPNALDFSGDVGPLRYSNDRWVVWGFGNHLWTSLDAVSWTEDERQESEYLGGEVGGFPDALAHDGLGRWIAGDGKAHILLSDDGLNWAEVDPNNNPFGPSSIGITGLASDGLSTWVAGASNGQMAVSSNGTVWTEVTSSFGATAINQIAHDNVLGSAGLFVAVGGSGKVATSSDGISWTQRTSNFGTSDIRSVVHDVLLDLWVIVGVGGKLATSPDGITWTLRTANFGTAPLNEIANDGNGKFIAVGGIGKGDTYISSTDGITWTVHTVNPLADGDSNYDTRTIAFQKVR